MVPLRLFIYKRRLFLSFYSATKNTFYSKASTSKNVNADQRESCEDQWKGLYRPGVTRFREEVRQADQVQREEKPVKKTVWSTEEVNV